MVNALFGTAEFGNSNFNVVIITLTIADNVAAGDSFTSKTQFKRTNSDSTGLADGFKTKPKKPSADSVALNDNQSRKWNAKSSSGDSASVADGFKSAPRKPIAEGIGLADSFSFSWQTQMADTCVPNEAVSKIIKVQINDSATVADNQSKDTGKAAADYIIVRDERGLTPHIGPWEESFEYAGIGWNRSGSGYTALGTSGGLFGSNFAKVIDESTHAWKAWYGSTSYTLQPGKWYRASVYAYSPQVRGSYAYLFYNSTESRIVKSATWGTSELGPDKGWVRKESRFQVPADATILTGIPYLYGHINPNGLTSSEVWYDGYLLEGPFDTDPGPIGAPAQFNMSIQKADTAALADNVTRIWDAINALADSIGLSDAEHHGPKQHEKDSLDLAESFTRLWQAKTQSGEAITLADEIARKIAIVDTDILSSIDSLTLKAKMALEDALAMGDGTSIKALTQLADTLAMLDAMAFLYHAIKGDSQTVTDTITSKPRPVKDESILLAEAVSRAWQAKTTQADTLALGDAERATVKPKASDVAALSDGTSTVWQAEKTQADTVTATEALGKNIGRVLNNDYAATISNDADAGVTYEQFVDASYGPALRIIKPDSTNIYSYWSFTLPGTIPAGKHEIKWLMKTVNVQNMTGYSNNLFAELYCPDTATYSQHICGTTGWTEYTWNLSLASATTGLRLWFVIDRACGTAELAQLRMDGLPVWPIEQVSLADSTALKAKPTQADVLSMVDNLTNKIAALRTDTLSLADTLAARFGLKLADSLSLVEAIVAMVEKPQADSVTAADALALKAKALMQDTLDVAESATLKPKISKADAAAIVDAIAKLIKPRVSDTIAAADALSLVWQAYVDATEALSVVDGARVAVDKILADMAALGDNVANYFRKVLPDGVSFGEAVFGRAAFGGRTDPVVLSDSLNMRPIYLYEDLIALADEVTKLIAIMQAESIPVTETFAREWIALLSKSDAVVLAETLAKKTSALKADAAALSDALNKAWLARLAEAETLGAAESIAAKPKLPKIDTADAVDSLEMKANKSLSESAGVNDLLARAWQAKQAANDMTTSADATSVTIKTPKTDSSMVTDELNSIWNIARQNGDALVLADALMKLWQAKLAAGDSVTTADSTAMKARLAKTEAISTADSLLHAWQALSEIDENTSLADAVALLTMAAYGCSIGVSDAIARKASKSLTETLAVAESMVVEVGSNKSDAVGIADALVQKVRTALEDAAITEEFISKYISIALPRNLFNLIAFGEGVFGDSEVLAIADAFQILVIFLREYEESVALADQMAKLISSLQADSIVVADSLAREWKAVLNSSEAINLADELARKAATLKTDTASLSDAFNRVWQARPSQAETLPADDVFALRAKPSIADNVEATDDITSTWEIVRENIDSTELADAFDKLWHTKLAAGDSITFFDEYLLKTKPAILDSLTVTDSLLHTWKALLAINESTSIADAVTLLFMVAYGCSVEVTDALTKRASSSLVDTLAIVELLAAKASLHKGDVVVIADELKQKVRVALADALAAEEYISKYISIALPRNQFNVITFGSGAFGDSDVAQIADAFQRLASFVRHYGELVAIADELSMALRTAFDDAVAAADSLKTVWQAKYQTGDPASIADEFTRIWQAKKQTNDGIPLADAYISKPKPILFDSAVVIDGLARRWDAFTEQSDLIGITDATASKTEKPNSDTIASLVDELIKKSGAVMQDNTGISDSIKHIPGKVADDGAPVLDAFAFAVASYLSDTLVLNDWLAANARKLLADSSAINDMTELVAAFKRQWDETVELADQLEMLLGRTLIDALSLTDAVSSKMGKVYADGIGVYDSTIYEPGKYAMDALALLDSMLRKFGKYLAEALGIADAIGLQPGKQAQDLLAILDQLAARINAVLASTVYADDLMFWKLAQARNEAVTIAEALGMDVSKLPADMVGALDMIMLMPMLRKQETAELTDDVSTKKVVILNQVWINGVSVPVVDLKISQSVSERVSSCTFSIPNPSPEVLALCQQRAEIKAFLTDGEGVVEFFGGRLKANPIQTQNAITTRLDVTALDYADAANDILVSEIYEHETGVVITDVVHDIWGKYAPYSISLSGVVASTKTIPYIAFKFDTLFDATEYLAQLLGWSWYVDWDGSERTLHFYPPEMALKDITFSRANCNVVAGSAKFGQNDKIYNRIYVLGGTTLSGTVTYKIVADGTNTIYSLPHKAYAPEGQEMIGVTLNTEPLEVGYEYPYWPSGKDVLYSFQGKYLRWLDTNKPPAGAVIEVAYRYEYPVGYMMEDPASIERFGLSETRYIDTKINDARQAREKAQSMLQEFAYPVGYGTLETTEVGLRAGDFIKVDLPHVGGVGTYEITQIEKWTERTVVRRVVTLNLTDDPEARIAARLKEYADKLARLELKDLDEGAMILDIKAITEDIRISEIISFISDYEETDTDFLVVADGLAAKPSIILGDSLSLSGSLFVAISTGNCQFGHHAFGSAHFAVGQTIYD